MWTCKRTTQYVSLFYEREHLLLSQYETLLCRSSLTPLEIGAREAQSYRRTVIPWREYPRPAAIDGSSDTEPQAEMCVNPNTYSRGCRDLAVEAD